MPERKTPQVRFKGFTDTWEQRKLDDLCELITKQTGFDYSATIKPSLLTEKADNTYSFIQNKDFSGNDINLETDFYIPVEVAEKFPQILIDKPSLLISISGRIGNVGFYRLRQKAFIGGAVGICKLKDPDGGEFITQELESDYGQKYFQSLIKASSHANITVEDIRNIELIMPPTKEEREQISDFLLSLDNLITLHQREGERLQMVKKSMLENCFPKNGEKVPRFRFAGFTGDWEQRKLGELATFTKGAGYSKSDLKETGTPVVLYGRLYTKYETVIHDVDTFVDAKDGSIYSRGGEVVVPASGETAEDIAIASALEKSGILIGGDLNIIHPCNRLEPVFLAISISNGEPHVDMARRAQGKSVVHLHNEDLSRIELQYPEIEEQQEISQCFLNLDHLITLHQSKLEMLKKIKKSMLGKILV